MSEEQKPGKKLKSGVKLKTKPAVVPSQRKIKRGGVKLPTAMMGPQGIKKWNIIFTLIFGALLVLTIIQSYFIELIILPLPGLVLNILYPVLIFLEVFLVLLAFETFRVSFAPKLIRIILTILTLIVFFPLTLFKYHTRHNIWRIMFVGLTIGALILSFFSPYFNMIGKYRDLPPGDIAEQDVTPDWFSSLFQGSAPFYIDGLLDLLDALDLNDTLGQQEMARVDSSSALGNYLYRWEVNDRYDSNTWEFVASNAQQFSLDVGDYGSPPASTVQELNISQTVYTSPFSNSLLSPLLTTWSTYHTPHLESVSDYDYYLRDENNTIAAETGTTSITFNSREQLLLQSTTTSMGFLGNYTYMTYFAQDDIQAIIGDVHPAISDEFGTTTFNDTYAAFLQEPLNYRTISPNVASYASDRKAEMLLNDYNIYEQVIYILDDIIQRYGFPTTAQTDNNGQDRANLLILGSDNSVSAYIALAVMALRICGIPARPVFGFAIGDDIGGDPSYKSLSLSNLFGWVEALLPLNQGGSPDYRWGQFQIVPYPSGSDLIYCENTLYSAYNVSVSMLGAPLAYDALPTYSVSGDDVYLTDFNVQYTLRAIITTDGTPISGANVNFETISVEDMQNYQSNPTQLLDVARNIGSATTNIGGIAEYYTSFDETNYTMFDINNPNPTTYVTLAYVSLSSINGTSFVVLPEGYLSGVTMNATQRLETVPESPPNQANYYIAQKGLFYQITSTLYEDEAFTTPLVGKNVSYYVMNTLQFVELELGTLVLQDLWIGSDLTDGSGNSIVYSNYGGTDYFATLLEDTTYYVVALYGQNYTSTVMLVFDEVRSTIDINDTYLDVVIDGSYMFVDFDFSLFFQTGGTPEAIPNQYVEVWMAPESVYSAYVGTDPEVLKASHLLPANTSAPYNVQIVSTGFTDVNGYFNTSFKVDAYIYGAGDFVAITFYMGRFNASETITIETPPGALALTEENQESIGITTIEEPQISSQFLLVERELDYYFHSMFLYIQTLLRTQILEGLNFRLEVFE